MIENGAVRDTKVRGAVRDARVRADEVLSIARVGRASKGVEAKRHLGRIVARVVARREPHFVAAVRKAMPVLPLKAVGERAARAGHRRALEPRAVAVD